MGLGGNILVVMRVEGYSLYRMRLVVEVGEGSEK